MAVTYDDNTIIESATYTADQRVRFKPPPTARALHLIISCTSIFGGSPSVTPNIQVPDAAGGWTTILAGVAIQSVSTQTLKVGIAYTASPNAIAKEVLSQQMALFMDHADTDQIAYSVALNWGQ